MPNKINTKNESQQVSNDAMEPKRTLISRKVIRLGTMIWAKLDGWPWWPGMVIFSIFQINDTISELILFFKRDHRESK